MSTSPSVVWLRDDLRLADNPALTAAAERGAPVAVLYLLDEASPGVRPLGGASKWWLNESLRALDAPVILRRGAAAEELPKLVAELGAGAVFWNRRYGGAERAVDAALKTSLRERGLEVQSFQANLMHEPWTVTSGSGTPFEVFTPFWRACLDLGEPRHPLPVPSCDFLEAPSVDLELAQDWPNDFAEHWTPGEKGAHERLEQFDSSDYQDTRDEPAQDATSHLSPHLRFGEISPFQVWHSATSAAFRREVGWREFNWNILYHFPTLATDNFRPEFDAFPWSKPDAEVLKAWQQGRTGIPLVDAGMRELWRTGYMHNRVRMIVASFLIKNLLVDWRVGEAWFWDTLVDADQANNPANWQWVAGSGADAAPYFRVFNPLLQAEKFDKHGEYRRRWVPELGTDEYPEPIVDLKSSRAEALEAYEHMRRSR
ncbi:MAG: photolyase [Microbacteriaceae bacterium]|nr:photolyase [Microbacteriaceae bacterium]